MSGLNPLRDAFENIRNLQFGNSGTVVGALETTEFLDSIYVNDAVDEYVRSFFNVADPSGELLIITGSAGDGKSAILARAYGSATSGVANWLGEEHINLDATASRRRDQSNLADLNEFLKTAQKDLQKGDGPRRGIAMNLGIGLSFFEKSQYNREGQFSSIWSVIEAARDPKNLDDHGIYQLEDGISVVNLSYRPIFSTDPNSLGEGLLQDIVDKFIYTNETSQFANLDSLPDDPKEAISDTDIPIFSYNLAALAIPAVRERYTRFLAALSLSRSEYINPRQILHYVSTALVPEALQDLVENEGVYAGQAEAIEQDLELADMLFWNTVYESLTPATPSTQLDPCVARSSEIDELVLEITGGYTSEPSERAAVPGIYDMDSIDAARTSIRYSHLTAERPIQVLTDQAVFRRYSSAATVLDDRVSVSNMDVRKATQEAFQIVKGALRAWSGRAAEGDWIKVDDGRPSGPYALWRFSLDNGRREVG